MDNRTRFLFHAGARSLLGLAAALLIARASLAQTMEDPVRFASGEVEIAGVVTRPDGSTPRPAIVLIDGSGRTDRHNMRDFSNALAQAGFVTLAYDKRGVGGSTGDPEAWHYFSIKDLAQDAAAGADFLSTQEYVAADRIGLLGISQGGWVAPLAATLSGSVSFMVLLSPSVTTIAEDRLFERARRLGDEGFSATEVAEARAMQLEDQRVTRTGDGLSEFETLWRENAQKRWFRRVYPTDDLLTAGGDYRDWFRDVMDFDARPILRDLSIPVLWCFGDPEHDHLTPVAESIEIVEMLRDLGKDYTVHQFPGTNHNIMPVEAAGAGGGDTPPPYAEPLMQWLERFID